MIQSTRPHPLTHAQLAVVTAMLDEQWQFRVEQVAQLSAPAPVGRWESAVEAEVRSTILHGARLALADIRSARARLAVGTFGRCVTCSAPLSRERLEILPQAARCSDCQSTSGQSVSGHSTRGHGTGGQTGG